MVCWTIPCYIVGVPVSPIQTTHISASFTVIVLHLPQSNIVLFSSPELFSLVHWALCVYWTPFIFFPPVPPSSPKVNPLHWFTRDSPVIRHFSPAELLYFSPSNSLCFGQPVKVFCPLARLPPPLLAILLFSLLGSSTSPTTGQSKGKHRLKSMMDMILLVYV